MKEFIYQKLATTLKEKIMSNVWRENERLPSIRKLSEQYAISKISVQTALHKLEASGLIKSKPKSGYYVLSRQNKSPTLDKEAEIKSPCFVKVPNVFHEIMENGAAFDIYPSAKVQQNTSHIELLNRHINRAMRQHPITNSLYYDNPEGVKELQIQISEHYRSRGLFISPDEICITSGCQNSLFLALSTCCEPGDIVVIESPAFYGCLQLLQLLKLKVIELPSSSDNGIKSSDLQNILDKWKVKACVFTPNFSTPTGVCISLEEKKSLITLANIHNFTIIEDDIYGDLGFHFTPEPLKCFDTSGKVILCSSISKSLSRDLRIGWIVGGEKHSQIIHQKLVNSLATNKTIQQGLASFMAEGFYRRHLIQYRQTLVEQRNLLINGINEHWHFPFYFTIPDGGLSIWIELEPHIDTTAIYKKALKLDIIMTPGMLFSSNKTFLNCLRLSFVHKVSGQRLEALKKIGNIIEHESLL
jgi:DNA-binding transcriptional MocR family regulator